MFYNAHVFIAEKLYSSNDPLLITGSILPDIAITKIFDWNKTGLHGKENVKNFYNFILKNFPEFEKLALGVLAHNILDDFSHNNYSKNIGYAYQNNQQLINKVSRYYESDKELTERKAHNFIETGVDILMLKDFPNIQNDLEKSLAAIDSNQLCKLFEKYFDIKKTKALESIKEYYSLITEKDLSIKTNWIFLWKKLNRMMGLKNITDQEILDLIDTGIETIRDTYKDFISYSITTGRRSKNTYV